MSAKIAALLVLIGFAASAHAQPAPKLPFDLSPEDVEGGFIMAMMDGCVNAAETGRTLDQLNPYRIIRDTNRGAARAPKPGHSAWAPGIGVGVVEINDGPGGCEVLAYGAGVESTFGAIVSSLRAKGYDVQASGRFGHELVRTANGRTVKVVLAGHEPATASDFSGLTAFVTATSP